MRSCPPPNRTTAGVKTPATAAHRISTDTRCIMACPSTVSLPPSLVRVDLQPVAANMPIHRPSRPSNGRTLILVLHRVLRALRASPRESVGANQPQGLDPSILSKSDINVTGNPYQLGVIRWLGAGDGTQKPERNLARRAVTSVADKWQQQSTCEPFVAGSSPDSLQCAGFFVFDLQHDVEIERSAITKECSKGPGLDGLRM